MSARGAPKRPVPNPGLHPKLARRVGSSRATRKAAQQSSDTASSVVSFTQTATELRRGHVSYENTFQLAPVEGAQFQTGQVEQIIHRELEAFLCDVTYDAARCSALSRELAGRVKGAVRELQLPRYKLVCTVSVGQNTGQGLALTSRCLWDDVTDTYASATYSTAHVYAVGTVYGLYYD